MATFSLCPRTQGLKAVVDAVAANGATVRQTLKVWTFAGSRLASYSQGQPNDLDQIINQVFTKLGYSTPTFTPCKRLETRVAQNVFLSMIYLGNYADIDTNESNLATENESSLFGTYGSTSNPLHAHVVSAETDSPTEFIDANHDTGNGDLSYDVGSGSVTVGLDSFVTFYGMVTYADGSNESMAIDILQMTNGDLFMSAWDNYTQFGTNAVVSISLNSVEYDRWGGFEQSNYDSVQFVCFATGTRICTSGGEVPVESLGVDDLVVTRDHGLQPIQWLRHDSQTLEDVGEHERPVLIRAGALGPGIPSEDLIVSPNHRILVGGSRQLRGLFQTEAFAPAKSLTSLR